jgi:threonine/homoserine/homoserine lactone efflux protein
VPSLKNAPLPGPDAVDLSLFIPYFLASMVCIATPGTDSIGTLSIGMSRGARQGASFALGVGLGCLTHTLWATLGIAAIVAASETLFAAIKYLGAAYLLYLGIQCLRSKAGLQLSGPQGSTTESGRLVVQGFLSNALNPKVMLFFIAFLPQFVNPAVGPIWQQMLFMGVGFALLTGLSYIVLGLFAGRVGTWLMRKPSAILWLNRLTGAAFIGLALRLAVAERK